MYTKSILIGASLVAAVSAGPLPHGVATKLAGQEGLPTHFPAPIGYPIGGPEGPAAPQGTGTAVAMPPAASGVMPIGTTSAPMSTGVASPPSSGTGTTTSVNVKGSVNGPLAVSSINDNDGKGSGSDAYKMYSGDGSTGAG